jgi:stearoyl-CoA desaturase (delta-9 desaturase)
MTPATTNRITQRAPAADDEKIDLIACVPFFALHLTVFFVLWSGTSWIAVTACFVFFFLRLFALTGGYHRYFSHRSYKTSRVFQFLLALLGASAAQNGPLWWAGHHRQHHRYSDTDQDVHSPVVRSFWWSHVGWVLCRKYSATNLSAVPDLARFPELRFLNRFHLIAPTALAVGLFEAGGWLERHAPDLNTSGFQMLTWGFFVSTIILYHVTFTVNSITHLVGRRRFALPDNSRNNWWIALLTMGEGWHNNHHRYQNSERQGFYWWEIDMTHYILTLLSWMGLVWDVRTPPKEIYEEAKQVVGVAVSGHPQ